MDSGNSLLVNVRVLYVSFCSLTLTISVVLTHALHCVDSSVHMNPMPALESDPCLAHTVSKHRRTRIIYFCYWVLNQSHLHYSQVA